MSQDSAHTVPLGGGHTCLTPKPCHVLDARLGSSHRSGRWEPTSGVRPGPSPQPPGLSPQPSRVQPTHIWSQGSRRSRPSRSGLGSLTKMSPLQVTDQMACGEGRPCILRLSQQDRLSRVSWRGGRRVSETGLAPRWRPPPPPKGPPPAHPVAHVLLGGSGQAHGPPLPRSLGVYRAKECLASLNTGTSAVTSLRNTWMYCMQSGGQRDPGWSPAPWGNRDRGPWGPQNDGAPCAVGGTATVGARS